MKKIFSLAIASLMLLFTGCDPTDPRVPDTITIEGVTYRTGFYGKLAPQFGTKGSVGAEARQEEKIFDDEETYEFRRVEYEEYDWVHLAKGRTTGGTVYCAEDQWEQMVEYYADPANYDYYISTGSYDNEKRLALTDIDLEKYEELLAFSEENAQNPFNSRHNKEILKKADRILQEDFQGTLYFHFYHVSKDGFFLRQRYDFFVYDSKFYLLFHVDYSNSKNGIVEIVGVEVPGELGQYFMSLVDIYGAELS